MNENPTKNQNPIVLEKPTSKNPENPKRNQHPEKP
jgi:hypothetical protein